MLNWFTLLTRGMRGATMGKTGLRPETPFGKWLLHTNVQEYFQIVWRTRGSKSTWGAWGAWVDGYSLDCYDYESTCGAKNIPNWSITFLFMNWQKTQSPWLKILAVFGADEPMSSVSAQKQSPWVETVSPRAHEFRHNPKKGPQKTPKFMGSLPHDRAHITCWLGSGWRGLHFPWYTLFINKSYFWQTTIMYSNSLQPNLFIYKVASETSSKTSLNDNSLNPHLSVVDKIHL